MKWLIVSLLGVTVLLLAYLVYKTNRIEDAVTPGVRLIAVARSR